MPEEARRTLDKFCRHSHLDPFPTPPSPAHCAGPLPSWIFFISSIQLTLVPCPIGFSPGHLAFLPIKFTYLNSHPPPPPRPLNGSLIRPAFHACPLLYLFINFIPSPLFLPSLTIVLLLLQFFLLLHPGKFFSSFSSLFFFTTYYT